MIINNSKTIKDIQKEFSQKFPFLKIEFYRIRHQEGEGSPKSIQYDPETPIRLIRYSDRAGDVSINGNLKVSTLERILQDEYRLFSQVFYKSGDIWLQTTSTDDWTLSEQNERAKSFSEFQANR